MRPITIPAGHQVTRDGLGFHVPKRELASVLQALLQSHRWQVAKGLREVVTLTRELSTFQVKLTAAANLVFGTWRGVAHDDLVLAVALACWLGEWPVRGLRMYLAAIA